VISARVDKQIALLPELKLVEHELARALARAPVVEVADRETAVGEVAEKIRRSLTIGKPPGRRGFFLVRHACRLGEMLRGAGAPAITY
jgi:DNA-directed RNA polymerase subunit H (RpoH/RPB5)